MQIPVIILKRASNKSMMIKSQMHLGHLGIYVHVDAI